MDIKNNIVSSDISVVVQGAIGKYTKKCLQSVRKYLPEAELILSTWEDSDVEGLEYDVLLLNPDPGAVVFTKSGAWQNHNRQILSTQNGLKKATRKYALKLRSDSVLKGTKFLNYFGKYQKRADECKILKERVLINNWHTRMPKFPQPLLFHVSDFFMFGLYEDVLNIWDIPLTKEPEHSSYFQSNVAKNPKFLDDNCYTKFHAEMYIWIEFLRKNGVEINMQDWTDCLDDKLVQLSELSIANNTCVLDYKSQFDIVCLKYPYPNYPCVSIYHFSDWVKNYEKFCGGKIQKGFEYYLSAIYAFFHSISCFIKRNKKKAIRVKFGKKEKYIMLFGEFLYRK